MYNVHNNWLYLHYTFSYIFNYFILSDESVQEHSMRMIRYREFSCIFKLFYLIFALFVVFNLIFFNMEQNEYMKFYERNMKAIKNIHWCSKLRYRRATNGRITGLMSFPGSGNTWLRYLLQQSTGVVTGSIYYDPDLYTNGFPGECLVNQSALVVKAHMWDDVKVFSRVILLLRDPAAALLAEYNRRRGNGHTSFATPKDFMTKNWKTYVKLIGYAWRKHNLQCSEKFAGRLHVVYFEDLVHNLEETLRGILKFINHPVDEDLMRCTLSNRGGAFKRIKPEEYFTYYNDQMVEWLLKVKNEVYQEVAKHASVRKKIPKLKISKFELNASKRDCPKGINDE